MTTSDYNKHRSMSLAAIYLSVQRHTKKPYNNYKLFNFKQKSICSGDSMLGEFFSSGRLPAVNTTVL